jgi:hypothetical protein
MTDLLTLTQAQRAVYSATYGAYFAAQVHARMESGRGAPDEDDYDRYAEEADTVAVEAVARLPISWSQT